MNIANFVLNQNIINNLINHLSIFENEILLFICYNGFCFTQNISSNTNLNTFISKDHFDNYNLNLNHIQFLLKNNLLCKLDKFEILINKTNDNQEIFYISNNNQFHRIEVFNDDSLYSYCTNINKFNHHNIILNKNHFEKLIQNNKLLIKKFCDSTSFDYDNINFKFYKNINGFVLNFHENNINIDYDFNICIN